ncbi:peroxisomal membrane protein PEX13 [Nephila pilipes]|uniref:Peroxisomal membrane protein PEX13 n=1 Tax=Nephila pilipes TaxID=299642 RepID=A0A8X6Q080_NEPPI|nr:peroxisomal membrane protein PEX13 [Nephila pilipes]GFU48995.1 peroxisomal membrane protein PEX13 [Nephila pilipes]
MALKNNGKSTTSSNSNQLNRSVVNNNRGLQALGGISRINPENRGNAIPLSTSYLKYPMSISGTGYAGPPPLPPRPSPYMSNFNRYSTMSGFYSPYSRYSPGYGGYRMPSYGHYGPPNDTYSSFIQMAEESTRPAFESIESVVEVVSSISMMLESTYHAVHSSYSAILGVVDQFSRLKDHLAQILSVLTIIRGLRWLCLKVLYLLKLRKENPSVDAAWDSAEQMANASLPSGMPVEPKGSAWPFLMFVGLVIGAPWLMFKLLSKSISNKKPIDPSVFVDNNGKRYLVTAEYDFTATQPHELSFRAGEKLFIAPKSVQKHPRGWFFACNDREQTGIIPSNYLKPVNKLVSTKAHARQVTSKENIAIPEQMPSELTEADEEDSAKPPEKLAVIVEKPLELSDDSPNSKSDSGFDSS